MSKLRVFLIAGVGLVLSAGPALGDQFKPLQFVWRIWTGSTYQVTPVLESIVPIDFELVDRHSDAAGLYYGVPSEVTELERAGQYEIPKLAKGVFQSTYARQIPGTKEAKENPLFDLKSGRFAVEKHVRDIREAYSKADFEIITMRRADTPHFPILITEVRLGHRQLNVVYIALTDDANGTIAQIAYHMPEKPSIDNFQIWNRFLSGLREK